MEYFEWIILIVAYCFGIIGIYYLSKSVIRTEISKTLPAQVESIRGLLGNKPVRLIIEIMEDGSTTIKDFQIIDKVDYIN